MFLVISKVLDQAHRHLLHLVSRNIPQWEQDILPSSCYRAFWVSVRMTRNLSCLPVYQLQIHRGAWEPSLLSWLVSFPCQRAARREIQGVFITQLRTCFYTCSSSPAMVLYSSTNYSPFNKALLLYLFSNTTASNISTPKAYTQFFFRSRFKQNTHWLLTWTVRLTEHSKEKH